VGQMIDPSGAANYTIESVELISSAAGGYVDIDSSGILTYDLDQFTKLTAGQAGLATINIYTSNPSGATAKSTVAFYVFGADDAVTTITTANGAGNLVGTAGHDVVIDIANQGNALFGGQGADTFQFRNDFSDGNPDENTIFDYQVGRDTVEFSDGTVIQYMFEVNDGVILTLDGGQDVLFIYGREVNLDNLDMQGQAYRSIAPDPNTGALDPSSFQYFIQQYGQTNATFSDALGFGFGGIYGVNIDFG